MSRSAFREWHFETRSQKRGVHWKYSFVSLWYKENFHSSKKLSTLFETIRAFETFSLLARANAKSLHFSDAWRSCYKPASFVFFSFFLSNFLIILVEIPSQMPIASYLSSEMPLAKLPRNMWHRKLVTTTAELYFIRAREQTRLPRPNWRCSSKASSLIFYGGHERDISMYCARRFYNFALADFVFCSKVLSTSSTHRH